MSAKVVHSVNWSRQRIGGVLVLLFVLVVAGIPLINRRNDPPPGQLAGTPGLVHERVSALRSAMLRLEQTSTSAEDQDRAFFATCKAMDELAELHAEAAPGVPLIAGVLSGPERHDRSGDTSLRARADSALRRIGKPAVEAAVALLNHKDAQVRSLAALTLSAWASRRTMLPADIPMSDLQIAVPALKNALSRETDELTQEDLRFALHDVSREEALKLGIRYPASDESSENKGR